MSIFSKYFASLQCLGRALAAGYVIKGESLTGEGWTFCTGTLEKVVVNSGTELFESHLSGLGPPPSAPETFASLQCSAANLNKEHVSTIEGMEELLVAQQFVRKVVSLWVPSEMVVLGNICFGPGVDRFVFVPISDVKESWEGHERCTAVLVRKTLVMSLYAPTADDVAFCENGWGGQVRSVLREARGKGEERVFVGDFNFELGDAQEVGRVRGFLRAVLLRTEGQSGRW